MGRRALPKLDPQLDFSAYFTTVDQLPDPWDLAELWEKSPLDPTAPLEIELGSGKGLFLQTAATAFPNRHFLGLEVGRKYAEHTAARLAKHELHNALAVHGDGLRVFRELVPDASLAAVHVYFPDPWWKTRHRKRRVLNEPFLNDVVRTLKPGGRLHFWTDVKEYFDATLKLIAAKIDLAGPLPVPERQAEHEMDFRTHFERRKRLNGEPIYRSEFVKECKA